MQQRRHSLNAVLASTRHLEKQRVAHLDAKPCVATCASRKHIAQSVSSGGHQKRSDCGGQRAARERAPAAQGHRPKHIGRRPEQVRLIGDAKPAATAPTAEGATIGQACVVLCVIRPFTIVLLGYT